MFSLRWQEPRVDSLYLSTALPKFGLRVLCFLRRYLQSLGLTCSFAFLESQLDQLIASESEAPAGVHFTERGCNSGTGGGQSETEARTLAFPFPCFSHSARFLLINLINLNSLFLLAATVSRLDRTVLSISSPHLPLFSLLPISSSLLAVDVLSTSSSLIISLFFLCCRSLSPIQVFSP